MLSSLRALRVRALSTAKAPAKKPAAGGDKAGKGEAKPAGDKKRTPPPPPSLPDAVPDRRFCSFSFIARRSLALACSLDRSRNGRSLNLN
jgi:hypothetical protein